MSAPIRPFTSVLTEEQLRKLIDNAERKTRLLENIPSSYFNYKPNGINISSHIYEDKASYGEFTRTMMDWSSYSIEELAPIIDKPVKDWTPLPVPLVDFGRDKITYGMSEGGACLKRSRK